MAHKMSTLRHRSVFLLIRNYHTYYEYPFCTFFRLYRKTVRAFTDSAKPVYSCLKFSCFLPVFKIFAKVEFHLFSCCHNQTEPFFNRIVKHFRVSEIIFFFIYNNRIPVIFFKMLIIRTISYTLYFFSVF